MIRRPYCFIVSLLVIALLSGCAQYLAMSGQQDIVADTPRWACPTPTPLPTIQVEDGEETRMVEGTPVTETRYRDTEPYEIEYGLPVVQPTPYTKEGTSFYLGQIVNMGGGTDMIATIGGTEALPDNQRLYMVKLEVKASQAITLTLERAVVISAIQEPSGRYVAGDWRWNLESARAAGMPETADATIPAGESTLEIPIIAPDGEVTTLDVRFDSQEWEDFRVQFTEAVDPLCEQPGTHGASYETNAMDVQAPPVPGNANGLVASALSQVGRQYCWGGKGYQACSGCSAGAGCVTPACASIPCFDCSGLTWWAYSHNGISIGHGTANQKLYPAVSPSQAQPGDLILFTGGPAGSGNRFSGIRHVGMYAGDVNGNGTGDLIHAANYPAGVIIDDNIFNNGYWAPRIAVITRPPH